MCCLTLTTKVLRPIVFTKESVACCAVTAQCDGNFLSINWAKVKPQSVCLPSFFATTSINTWVSLSDWLAEMIVLQTCTCPSCVCSQRRRADRINWPPWRGKSQVSRVSVISNCASSTQCANPNGQNFLQGIEGFEYEVNKEIVFDNVTYNSQIEHGNHSLHNASRQRPIW